MNKCYDAETMIAFVMDPLKPENAELASHLLTCRKCREEYHVASQVIAVDSLISQPSEEEIREAEAATARLLGKKKWDKLNDLAEMLKQKFDAAANSISARFSAKMLFAPSTETMVFAASSKSRPVSVHEQPPMLTFESTAASCFKEYWKLNLHFPATVSKSSMLTLKLYDAEGKALTAGRVLFQGQVLNVTAGIAVLSLKDFITGAKIPEVAYQFPDGTKSEGIIKFLPDIA